MRFRRLGALLPLIVLWCGFATIGLLPPAQECRGETNPSLTNTTPYTPELDLELELLALTNRERIEQQLPALVPDPALTQIAGKVRGLLKHRDGRRVLFADLSVALRDIPGVKQYQVIQETLDDFVVRLVTVPGIDPVTLEPAIHLAFREHFGYSPNIVVRQENDIARGDNGKFYASICKI